MNAPYLIIDTDYLCHRSRWALGDLVWEGHPTGVIYGVLQTIIQLQERFNTHKLIFCFDSSSNKRKTMLPGYKGTRKHRKPLTRQEQLWEDEFYRQIQLLRISYLPDIGFANVFIQKGYESDDLIAKLALDIEEQVIIISADKDLFQCLRGDVSLYNPQKHHHITLQRFYKVYGITPKDWVRVKALAGCPSDNVKGIRGIGEKTALKWIKRELPSHTVAYQKLTSSQAKVILKQNWPIVKLPLKGTKSMSLQNDNINKSKWNDVCHKLGFKSLIKPGARKA